MDLTVGHDGATVADVKRELVASWPALAQVLDRLYVICNESYAAPDTALSEGDELLVLPLPREDDTLREVMLADVNLSPTLGAVAIVKEPLSAAKMYDLVTDPLSGAVVLFSGTVREMTKGRQTLFLEYEAYEEMALAKMQEIIERCKQKWPINKMAMWHRIGHLDISEISVLIGISTAHRTDAYAASRYAIDTLKQIVPIWKKEFYQDGEVQWGEPNEPWAPIPYR